MTRILVQCALAVGLHCSAVSMFAQQTVVAETRDAKDRRGADHLADQLLVTPVTIDLERVTVLQAIQSIAKRSGVRIQYRNEVLEAATASVTLHAVEMPLGTVLDRVLAETGLHVVPSSSRLLTIKGTLAPARLAGALSGRVVDAESKRPLRGVKVLVDDVARGTTTGEDGTYRVSNLAIGTHRVTARLIGYTKETKRVEIANSDLANVDFALRPPVNALDQVVVTGTVVATELKAVPSAITVITAKQIEERGITHIDQLFRGDIPGLFALNRGSASALDEVQMFSRGATALSPESVGPVAAGVPAPLSNPIKTYVDGVELANPRYLSQIDPKSIERIEILTGPQASTIYGSNAMNGVMQIFTKRGTSSRPQLTLNLLSGWVENNFSTAKTPQHDLSVQLTGVEGKVSYSGGTSWLYVGPWTPGKQTTRLNTFGAVHLDINTGAGAVSTDVTVHRASSVTRELGDREQSNTEYRANGWWRFVRGNGRIRPTVNSLDGQTLGFAMTYTPASWWSHEIGFGVDASDVEVRSTGSGYTTPRDTAFRFSQSNVDRRSVRYTTTMRVPLSSLAQMTTTLGVDAWQSNTSSMSISPATLTGPMVNASGVQSISRQPYHNTGSFLQAQVALKDQLFLTYGLRAEWNPTYGSEEQPNYAPRFGAAYTRDVGGVTAKLRWSYGRSTRPPQPLQKTAYPASATLSPYFSPFDLFLANPDLSPEYQQGGEGGLELYFGARGSLVVTRYNQTVNRLIVSARVDTMRSSMPCEEFLCDAEWYDMDGYGYWGQYKYVNIGSIRNQGWELQGSTTLGPLTARGTYSWTKSRTIGLDPRYRAFFTPAGYPQYQPGASFDYLPEHTWSSGVTYARAAVTVGFDVTGVGRTTNQGDAFYFRYLAPQIRLLQNLQNVATNGYLAFNRGYALANLFGSYRLSSRVEGTLQIQNLADRYVNDSHATYAMMGRQSKIGVRMRVM